MKLYNKKSNPYRDEFITVDAHGTVDVDDEYGEKLMATFPARFTDKIPDPTRPVAEPKTEPEKDEPDPSATVAKVATRKIKKPATALSTKRA